MELEEEKRRMEKARKEQEEYEQWKQMMSVDQSGTVTQEQQEKEARVGELLSVVKERKVVLLEDLASEFSMKTVEVMEFLDRLETEGKLTGVSDDRGKYIYITREELEKVAAFIKRRGRVSIEDIARESNKLIDLNVQHDTKSALFV